ncbi:hypothetical protein J5N97_020210 [Dioscorea zingiberensis]|uniref:Uncharacterized protein n=1 Tax=Dioscorea zingiberensis TaxID=325984 RepID=A0A9D5CFF2_9LILI|nr:hypothetical protein J5N97_020210 [Dioscorea zingiberensis]
MTWSSLHTTSQSPGPRDSHSAALVGHKMIIFGGTNGSRKVNDLHILDLKTKEWTKPNCKGIPPSPRESHTATVVGEDKLVIFGGSGEGEANYLNDIHILDLRSMTWTSPVVKDVQPVARDSHTAVAVGNKLLIYGGDCGDRYYDEVDVLDIETMTWLRIYIIGGVGDKQYFSDVWMLDMVKCTWTLLDIRGKKPRGRFSHTAVATGAEIVIYGGCGEDERPLDELLVLQLGSRQSDGPPNVSMCKIFGNCLNQDNGKAFRGTAELNKRIVYEYSALNQKSEEAELETRRCFSPGLSDVHGTVDGAFDSWILDDRQVNGCILRGVLFPPCAGLTVCKPQVHYESSPVGSPGIAFQQYPTPANAITIPVTSRQPSNFVVSECGHYLHQAHSIRVPKELPRPINDLLGVDLTLGGPGVGELYD